MSGVQPIGALPDSEAMPVLLARLQRELAAIRLGQRVNVGGRYRFEVNAAGQLLAVDPTAGLSRVLLPEPADPPAPGTVVAILRANVGTSIVTGNNAGGIGGVMTAISFDSSDLDRWAGVAGRGLIAATRYRPAAAGWYEIDGVVAYPSNATGYRVVWGLKNDAFVVGSAEHLNAVNGGQTFCRTGPTIAYCNGTTDYLGIAGWQNSGAAMTTVANRSAMNIVYRGQ